MRFRVFLAYFVISLAPLNAVTVEFFPSGQGNTILVRHANQAMIIDAGSSEMKFPAAYHVKATPIERSFELENPQLHEEDLFSLVTARKRTPADHHADSAESSSGGASPDQAPGAKRARGGGGAAAKKKTRDVYEQALLASIRALLPQDEAGTLSLRTLLITHADEDHYNLIPKIFASKEKFRVGNVILGGFYAQYTIQ